MLDLSALDNIEPGKPLMLDIENVIEDPNQPRQDFDEKTLQELADDIKERGVKNPISVKPVNSDGYYIINAGARRRRAAILAGLKQIPGFIDHDFTDYDQVNENEQRENLTPMEMALFIGKRLDSGDKAQDIAKRLKKDNAEITHLKALLDLPDILNEIYRSGRCRSPRFLYDLKNLYNLSPEGAEIVIQFLSSGSDITAKSIANLKSSLQPGQQSEGKNVHSAQGNDNGANNILPPNETEGTKPTAINAVGVNSNPTKNTGTEDPSKIKKPVLMVKHGKRSAVLLLDRQPQKEGHVFIRYEGAASDKESVVEILASALKIEKLLDSSRK